MHVMSKLKPEKRKVKKRRNVKVISEKPLESDTEIIEMMKRNFVKQQKGESVKIRASDVLRAIKLKRQIEPQVDEEKTFWEMIEELRAEELPKMYGKDGRRKSYAELKEQK